jgi:hypothetical protein
LLKRAKGFALGVKQSLVFKVLSSFNDHKIRGRALKKGLIAEIVSFLERFFQQG